MNHAKSTDMKSVSRILIDDRIHIRFETDRNLDWLFLLHITNLISSLLRRYLDIPTIICSVGMMIVPMKSLEMYFMANLIKKLLILYSAICL